MKRLLCVSLWGVPLALALANYAHALEPAKPGAAPASTSQAPQKADEFVVRDGDTWVQVGDSITWQKLWTTYLEAFIRARYPQLHFAAVNSGKSGEVTIGGLIRFRDTVAAYKPTLVTSAYGMNDHTKTFPGEQGFVDNPNSAVQRLGNMVKKADARWVVISASPLLASANYATDGGKFQLTLETTQGPSGWRSNPVNKLFADKMRVVAERNGALFLDQMTPLQTIWEANYERDRVAALRRAIQPFEVEPLTAETSTKFYQAIRPFTKDPDMLQRWPAPDRDNLASQLATLNKDDEALRQYLVGWAKQVDAQNPPFVQLSGYSDSVRPDDLIHPNQAGHLQMAGVLFKLMGGDGLVSNVVLNGKAGQMVSTQKATVSAVTLKNGVLSFKRLDESLPLPVDPIARPALQIDVETNIGSPKNLFGMSRYMTQISGLAAGNYQVTIDGIEVARTNAIELGAGLDLGLTDKGPIAAQSLKLLEAVQANLVSAPLDKLPTVPPPAPQTPKIMAEAQPIEHIWTVRPVP